jgi:pyruvate/2-oxoglutarate dehydrogenase complex dihydrolipoamide acyltransferase (E2) component
MTDIVLDPALWESMEAGAEAFVGEWLVAEGDYVHAGQLVGRANLVHTVVEVPALHAGTLEEICVGRGEKFSRGAVLARLIPT